MLRFLLLSTSLCCGGLGFAPSSSNAATGHAVPFETLGIVTGTTGINLSPPGIVRVRDNGDVESTRELLATGYDRSFADQVIARIGEIPSDRVVLIGVIDVSCTPAAGAGLRRTGNGDLEMYAPGHVPEPIECFVAVVSVAVLSVDADDAPPGSTDHADLVAFEFAGNIGPKGPTAVEITSDETALAMILPAGVESPALPNLGPDQRRFAFLQPGCRNTTAELLVMPQLVDVRLGYDDHGLNIDCAQAEYFLAVFDVPAEMVRDQSLLVGASAR